jgi:hypothetical protein
MAIEKYLTTSDLPRRVQRPETAEIYDTNAGLYRKLTAKEKKWTKFRVLALPTLGTTSISCGVRQWSNLAGYPPSLQIIHVLALLNEGRDRFSTVIFSDTQDHYRQAAALGNLEATYTPEYQLHTKKEIEMGRNGADPGQIMAFIINDLKGAAGSVVESEDTYNRNSGNHIKTFMWTIPRKTWNGGVEDFPFAQGIEAVNNWREANGALS